MRDNFGIQIIYQMIHPTLYDFDPYTTFQVHEYINKLKEDYKNTSIFQELIHKYLIQDNGNKIKFTMKPDINFEKEREREESMSLSYLSPEETEKIVKDNENLKQRRSEKDNIQVLPILDIKDIQIQSKYPKFNKIDGHIPIWYINAHTNGITSLRIVFDTSSIPIFIKLYLPLFTEYLLSQSNRVLQYMSTNAHSFGEGLRVELDSFSYNDNSLTETCTIALEFLDEKLDSAVNALTELFLNYKLDDKMLLNVMKNIALEKSDAMCRDGLRYALSYASSGLKYSQDTFETLRSDTFMCKIGQEIIINDEKSKNLDVVKESLKLIMEHLMHNAKKEFIIKAQAFDPIKKRLNKLCGVINKVKGEEVKKPEFMVNPKKHLFKIPQSANQCAELVLVPTIASPEYGKILVLAKMLSDKWVYPEIKNQAHSGGVKANSNGILSFYSHFDKKIEETFKLFASAIDNACNGNFNQDDLITAKFRAFKGFDVSDESILCWRRTPEEWITQTRKGILEASKDEIIEIARKYLKVQEKSLTVCAPKSVKDETLKETGWSIIDIGTIIHNEDSYIDF